SQTVSPPGGQAFDNGGTNVLCSIVPLLEVFAPWPYRRTDLAFGRSSNRKKELLMVQPWASLEVKVWGDFACFTRPEMKVERVSYRVPTPSAARGVLEAIFWEPEMYYLIDSITVVKPGKWFSFRRNEVQKVISIPSAVKWVNGKE